MEYRFESFKRHWALKDAKPSELLLFDSAKYFAMVSDLWCVFLAECEVYCVTEKCSSSARIWWNSSGMKYRQRCRPPSSNFVFGFEVSLWFPILQKKGLSDILIIDQKQDFYGRRYDLWCMRFNTFSLSKVTISNTYILYHVKAGVWARHGMTRVFHHFWHVTNADIPFDPPSIVPRVCSVHQGCQMAKFDPFLSLPPPSTLAQSKERKRSNFAA